MTGVQTCALPIYKSAKCALSFQKFFRTISAFAVFLSDISFSSFVFRVWYISIKSVDFKSNFEESRYAWNTFAPTLTGIVNITFVLRMIYEFSTKSIRLLQKSLQSQLDTRFVLVFVPSWRHHSIHRTDRPEPGHTGCCHRSGQGNPFRSVR